MEHQESIVRQKSKTANEWKTKQIYKGIYHTKETEMSNFTTLYSDGY